MSRLFSINLILSRLGLDFQQPNCLHGGHRLPQSRLFHVHGNQGGIDISRDSVRMHAALRHVQARRPIGWMIPENAFEPVEGIAPAHISEEVERLGEPDA
jgi:hypothetical protein